MGFEADAYGNERRVVFNELVGGHKMSEEDVRVWKDASKSTDPAQIAPQSPGPRWTWREDAAGKRTTRVRTATLTSALASRFPPDGGAGKNCLGLWSYYPEEGEDGRGELSFPKGAVITEVEEVNEDWNDGVYMGERGVLPKIYVRDLI